ncbi:hypothetical protein B1F79_05320 [Coxiella-like endosymbiont of Rhipicephalus sanguineus]|nr:hypothetical protein [Coxiella-like endosymbiont of Rhipicephalus sanguineus]
MVDTLEKSRNFQVTTYQSAETKNYFRSIYNCGFMLECFAKTVKKPKIKIKLLDQIKTYYEIV